VLREALPGYAAEARKQSAALTQQAAELDKAAAPLLQQLRQLMGCDYIPRPLKRGFDSPVNVETRPKSQVLKDEAVALELQANQLSRRGVQDSVALQGVYSEDFIADLMSRPLVMGPPLPEVAEWVKAQRSKGEQGKLTCFITNGRLGR
jgi:hypothetical protein